MAKMRGIFLEEWKEWMEADDDAGPVIVYDAVHVPRSLFFFLSVFLFLLLFCLSFCYCFSVIASLLYCGVAAHPDSDFGSRIPD